MGAAVLGANCQPGIDSDTVYPYLYGSTYLAIRNIGFVFVRVKKNDVSEQSRANIFREMDPFECGFLLKSDQVNGTFPIPIIRIVFTPCSKEPTVSHKTYSSPSEGASSLNNGQPCFMSYDFWCSGISPGILQPVEEAPERWAALADRLDPWKRLYDSAVDPDLLRSLLPGCGDNSAHFDSWCAPPSEPLPGSGLGSD